MKQLVLALLCVTFLFGCKKEEEPEPTPQPEPKRTVEYSVTGNGTYQVGFRDEEGVLQTGTYSNGMSITLSFDKDAALYLYSSLSTTTATIKVNGVVLVTDDVAPISVTAIVP